MGMRQDLVVKHHPEIIAGGYTQDDSTVDFYQRVMAVLPQGALVLDLGAGRGGTFEHEHTHWRGWLIRLGKRYARRTGADINPAVKSNPELDEAIIIEAGKPLPFDDQSFDLILCDWVVEHVEDPESFASEVHRVLKIGGWFCARTPNRWSYFAIGSRILPGALGKAVIHALQPTRRDDDVFPTFYRLNTLRRIEEGFSRDLWENASYIHNENKWYHGNIPLLYHLISIYQKLMPRSLGSLIMIFLRRIA